MQDINFFPCGYIIHIHNRLFVLFMWNKVQIHGHWIIKLESESQKHESKFFEEKTTTGEYIYECV